MAVGALITFGLPCGAAEAGKTSKELFDYIQEARKLGLTDESIQHNALNAGWDKRTIAQTYAAMVTGARQQSAAVLPPGYRIGAGDILQIVVWKEPEASVPEAVVRADGKISMPLIQEIEVAGVTVPELEKSLEEKMGKFIVSPAVTVVARQINSMRVYVVGAVKKEGPIAIVRPMTVLQALNEAGGLTDYAKRKKVYVLRNENGRQVKLPFDYQAVIRGEHLEQNQRVLPDDTIVVPQ